MKPCSRKRRLWLKAAVWTLRVAVGAVFLLSGVTKMVDPYGFTIKIGEYLAAWHWSVSPGLVLMGACTLSMVELITGLLLLTGSMRRLSVWTALGMMAFMLPLTVYIAVANPVEDCGCFGEFLIISNWATMWKNVALTAALVWLCRYNTRFRGLFPPMSQWLEIVIVAFYAMWIGVIGFNEQPLLDFRPYPVGEPLTESADAAGRISFVYAAEDESLHEFDADSLPDEDEGWTFVERRKQPGDVSAKALVVTDDDGEDVTDTLLGATDEQYLLLIPDLTQAGIANTYFVNEICDYVTAKEQSRDAFICLTDAPTEVRDEWADFAMADYPILHAEATAIKAVARGKMALVCVRDGVVAWKRTLPSVNVERLLAGEDLPTDGVRRFWRYTLVAAGAELLLCLAASAMGKRFMPRRRRYRSIGKRHVVNP